MNLTNENGDGSRDPPPNARPTPDFHDQLLPVFGFLAHRRRRYVHAHLLDAVDARTTFDRFLDSVVDRETYSSTDREAIATALSHVHLPRSEDANLFEYDRDRSIITASGEIHRYQIGMTDGRREERPDETQPGGG